MKNRNKLLVSGIFIIFFIMTPLFDFIKSYTVMFIYNLYEKNNSLLEKDNIRLTMPGGLVTKEKDWFPFVMTFNDNEGFSSFLGRDVELTILYNFGAFEMLKGSSLLYKKSSDYYSSFYGAYIIKEQDEKKFGFDNDGMINIKEISQVPKYDYKYLVLKGLGCDNVYVDFKINNINLIDEYIGYSEWYKIDAKIKTNSPIHKKVEDHISYIQYGEPPEEYYEGVDFPINDLVGRLYVRYFDELNSTIIFYVIAPNKKTIEKCDKKFLAKTSIKY